MKLCKALGLTIVAAYVVAGCSSDNGGALRSALADETGDAMTAERLGELVLRVDDEAVLDGSSWFFVIEGLETTVVYDIAADRMRIVIPILDSSEIDNETMQRLMQANFDTALDARYAIANGMVWATFIHPLSTLSDEEFLVGLAQTANIVLTFGSSYSSGMFIFGGGDSADIERRRLIDELRNKQRT